MSVSTQQFVNNATGEVVRVVKVTEKNYSRVADWINDTKQNVDLPWPNDAEPRHTDNGTVQEIHNQRVYLRTPKGFRVARVGDYVIRHGEPKVLRDVMLRRINDRSNFTFSVGKDDFLTRFTKLTNA